MDRVILSTEALNLNGFRVLTKGINLSAFRNNPVMLYNHRSWSMLPIGKWNKIKVVNGQLSAEPEFDPNDEEAQRVQSKFEGGYLNAASIGFRILATSDDPKDMVQGQRYPTVTKCLLYEASITPIPANSEAVRLYNEDGELIEMSDPTAVEKALSVNFNKTDMPGQEKKKSFKERVKALSSLLSSFTEDEDQETGGADNPPQGDGNLNAGGMPPAAPPTPPATPPAGQPTVATLSAQVTQLQADLTQCNAELTQLRQQVANRDKQLARQDRFLDQLEEEVRRLSGKPADKNVTGKRKEDIDTGDGKDDKTLTKLDHEVRSAYEREQKRRKKRKSSDED